MKRHSIALACLLLLSACGGGSGPTAPQPPPIAQVGGVWRGTQTLTGASGGDCLGATFAALGIGLTTPMTVAVTQSGASLSGTVTGDNTGLACTFTGTAGQNAISINFTACSAGSYISNLSCLSGARRDMQLVASSANGTVNGSVMTGTSADTYNTFVTGFGTSAGVMTIQSTFSITKQ